MDEPASGTLRVSGHWILTNVCATQADISYYFTHLFVSTSRSVGLQKTSQEIELIRPILEKLSPKTLVRVKGNMYPRILNCENLDHTDYPFDCYGAIFYINTNNGKTIIDNNVEIVPVQNRMLIFNSGIKHRSIHCTDQKVRVNINFNYF